MPLGAIKTALIRKLGVIAIAAYCRTSSRSASSSRPGMASEIGAAYNRLAPTEKDPPISRAVQSVGQMLAVPINSGCEVVIELPGAGVISPQHALIQQE
jgi:hypothetical protein